MKWIRTLYASVLVNLLWASSALADTTVSFDSIENAAKRSTDLSRQLLVMIFGDVVTNPLSTNATMVGQLFFIFNGIVFVLAVIWFLLISLKHITKAGHTGKVFGSGATPMAVVTTVAGFLFLVPTVSGWSLAQLVFLWAVSVMGIGSANLMTDKIADLMKSGYSLVMQPVAPQTVSSARAIYEMNLCMYATNAELSGMYSQYGKSDTPLMAIKTTTEGFEITNGSASCGSARLPTPSKHSLTGWLFAPDVNTDAIESAQRNAMNQMQNTLNQNASSFVTALLNKQKNGGGTLPDAETAIQQAARTYEDSINAVVNAQGNGDELANAMTTELKRSGWLSLGAWYQTFATANQKVNDAVALKPVVSGQSSLGDIGVSDTLNNVMTAYQAQLQNSPYTPPLGTQTAKETQEAKDASSPDTVFVNILDKPLLNFTNYIAKLNIGSEQINSDQMNPLLKMKAIGDYTLASTEIAFVSFSAVKISVDTYANGFTGKIVSILSLKGSDLLRNTISTISPFVYFVLLMLFGIGFSLSVYLPMIPFIFWLSAAANWIVSVLVGSTGGSLWAATHIGTEEEKGSRSAYGYIFLIDAQIRPMLMVLGFLFASLVVVAIGTLLNMLFGPTIANVQANSITGIVSLVGLLMIYARICTTTVTRVFALQVTMPDYVISWLGGREAASILGGMAESTKNIFAGFSHGLMRTPGANIKNSKNNNLNQDGIK
ncbi:DotA/TraY family protein [Salmonella enterica subsp. enterica]|uniref:DotA/TraY family protein n=1 Tax=Salmonella enterica TaxID=28901 RepID=A0A627Z6D6_SALER|nr:conjugal transfer protein [Salmonella enterica]EBS6827448.1 conjugal transfer protein [Salmonella enterica subsp. enterica serovar Manhattan]EBW9653090.1 conjugal transfer protein [Salmonella enterica subsp. enterica serovar Uganda]EBX2262628.1 conjugal transfer protein [Salmonella enterica subsp. enterica serovar Newport]EBX2618619.1 conjugal transfer protein [Salmonella enterica subsp. enterica serovar Sandiego]ECI7093441.1 conjugal transfer protein [Salmonella enterica subsp. enterica]E